MAYFNVASFMDNTSLEKISQPLRDVFKKMQEDDKGSLVLPVMIVLDMKRVLAPDKEGLQRRTFD